MARKRTKRPKAKRNPAPLWVTPGALEFVTQRKPGAVTVGDLVTVEGGKVARIEAVNPATRKIQARPLDGPTAGGLDKARAAFRAFSGSEPRELVTVKQGKSPRVAWLLGELEDVTYNTVRDGRKERYLHPFKRHARPLLVVDAETGQLFLHGGNYTVTDRGITDH